MRSRLLLLWTSCLAATSCGKPSVPFPKGFQWGVSESAEESEGNNTHSDWDVFASIGGAPAAGWAQNTYQLYDTDNANMQSLHLNAWQFTIEWARLVPKMPADPTAPLTSADIDPAEVAHYHQVIDSAIAHGLTPVVTVTHFSLPSWVDNPAAYDAGANAFTDTSLGGWTSPRTGQALAQYAAFLANEFGDKVKWWLTMDEPLVVLLAGYMEGVFPPGLSGNLSLDAPLPNGATPMTVLENMIAGHALAYHAMKAARPDLQVSFAHNSVVWKPLNPSSQDDIAATARVDFAYNLQFLDAVTKGQFDTGMVGSGPVVPHPEWANSLDYIGVNYYDSAWVLGSQLFAPLNATPCSPAIKDAEPAIFRSLGCPDRGPGDRPGMTTILLEYQRRYGMPMVVTESGFIDTPEGKARNLVQTLAALHDAIAQGAQVGGYFYWTLNYDYEWNDGWTQDMGLFEVAGIWDGGLSLPDGGMTSPGPNTDFTRIPLQPIDDVYASIAKSNAISGELLAQYGDAGP